MEFGTSKAVSLFPIRVIAAALLLTMAVFLFTGFSVYRAFHHYSAKMTSAFELQRSVSSLGAASTLSSLAQVAADTGDIHLEESYASLAVDLNRSLARIKELAPTQGIHLAADTLETVNQDLLGMQEQAFNEVRAGTPEAARRLLHGDRYKNRLQEFNRFYRELESSIHLQVQTELDSLTRNAYLVLGANIATIPILAFVWVAVLRILRRYLTTRRQLEEQLRDISLQDELTGLLNRRGFLTLARQQVRVADRTGKPLALLFADLDDLKHFNDNHGHSTGDRMLREAATILANLVRESDVLARIGGDEFVALLTEADRQAAEKLVERIRLAEQERTLADPQGLALSLSVGIVTYDPKEPCDLEDLIARADTLMYQRKRARKDPNSGSTATPA